MMVSNPMISGTAISAVMMEMRAIGVWGLVAGMTRGSLLTRRRSSRRSPLASYVIPARSAPPKPAAREGRLARLEDRHQHPPDPPHRLRLRHIGNLRALGISAAILADQHGRPFALM